jgi:thiamine kinase-like enzyme
MVRYLNNFTQSRNPHTAKFREIVDAVLEEEKEIVAREKDTFIQGHGDFHPKNIRIGQGGRNGRDNTPWVAAVDFEKSMVQPPALDVGYFLAQFRNQFYEHPEILRSYPERVFIDAYLENVDTRGADFLRKVHLFRARTHLSIASYLIGVGLGQTEKLWRVLVEAEHELAMYRAGRARD